MKTMIFPPAVTLLLGLLFGVNAQAGWIDWQSTSAGTLDDNGSISAVSLTGNPYNILDGDTYYNNGSTGGTSPGGTYAGLNPSDVVQVYRAGTFTIDFGQEVVNPYMALVSVGQPGYTVTYAFQNSFDVISSGSNFWGYGGYSVNGTQFNGNEFNGILQFTGTFSSISFAVVNNEYWHGFNFGTSAAESVPEPTSLFLMTAGLFGLGIARRRVIGSRAG